MIQINRRKAQTYKKEARTKKERFVHSCTFITNSTSLEKIADDLRTQLRAAKQIRDREANKNKSEIEYYKEQVETLKRLAAEKEALLIQKNLKNSLHSSKRSKRRSSSEYFPSSKSSGRFRLLFDLNYTRTDCIPNGDIFKSKSTTKIRLLCFSPGP